MYRHIGTIHLDNLYTHTCTLQRAWGLCQQLAAIVLVFFFQLFFFVSLFSCFSIRSPLSAPSVVDSVTTVSKGESYLFSAHALNIFQ